VSVLNRNQVVEILRLVSCEKVVCEGKEFIFNRPVNSKKTFRVEAKLRHGLQTTVITDRKSVISPAEFGTETRVPSIKTIRKC